MQLRSIAYQKNFASDGKIAHRMVTDEKTPNNIPEQVRSRDGAAMADHGTFVNVVPFQPSAASAAAKMYVVNISSLGTLLFPSQTDHGFHFPVTYSEETFAASDRLTDGLDDDIVVVSCALVKHHLAKLLTRASELAESDQSASRVEARHLREAMQGEAGSLGIRAAYMDEGEAGMERINEAVDGFQKQIDEDARVREALMAVAGGEDGEGGAGDERGLRLLPDVPTFETDSRKAWKRRKAQGTDGGGGEEVAMDVEEEDKTQGEELKPTTASRGKRGGAGKVAKKTVRKK